MRRALGTFETALTRTGEHAPFVVVIVVEVAGGPRPEILRRALDALQRHHPMLRVRIVGDPQTGYRFEPQGTPAIPLAVVRGGGGRAQPALRRRRRPAAALHLPGAAGARRAR
jgi:hypothetical protein